ncbi:cholesterol oxidase substrate-binding domain-containing protein [Streptomyces sp. NPDC059740]|uniref:cholesterol oxidase substrate-binding domain-containing protein n=1 Tax=Streptomyces sp. NPDC059740 TaxID=3346926 RepID=UPI0036675136
MTDGDTPETAGRGSEWSRRRAVAALSAGAGWLLTGTLTAAPARAAVAAGPAATAAPTPAPPGLPPGIPAQRHVFVNWSGEVRTDALWTCAPRDAEEVVALADWAATHGWRLRPRGKRHTWAPLAVADGTAGTERVVLLDTTAHLTTVSLDGPDTVRAGTGVLMEELLDFLGERGLGLTSCPAPGDLTLGGVLAIGGHGTAVPARGEERAPGQGYGSVSNRVVALTAVVWDEDAGRHVARTFERADPTCAALLVHLGRALVTEVVLRVEQDATLRCVSTLDVPASRLFAAPEAAGSDSFAAFLDRTGRAEAIWFAFTDHPWLKTWQRSPRRPFASRAVDGPYNYPFSDSLPEPVARLAGELAEGSWALTPLFGRLQYAVARAALTGDISDLLLSDTLLRDLLDGEALRHLLAAGPRSDLWGASRHLLLYIRPTTLRETADGYAVLVRRRDVQWVVHTFATLYRELLEGYAARR